MVFDLPCYFLWSYKGIKTYIHEYGDVLSLVLIYNMIIYTILHISHKFLQITLCTESKCISNTFYIYSFFFNFCIFCCCCSVAKSRLTLCDSMDCNVSGFSVSHHLPVCPSSCLLHPWYHTTILSSVVLFQLIGKDPDAGKDWRQKEKKETEDIFCMLHFIMYILHEGYKLDFLSYSINEELWDIGVP